MSTLWQYIQELSWFGSFMRGLADLSIIWVAYLTVRGYTYKTVSLSIGSFRVRRKDCTVQNVTNLVSLHYFGGGTVPDPVRKEILEETSPTIKEITKKAIPQGRKKHAKGNGH